MTQLLVERVGVLAREKGELRERLTSAERVVAAKDETIAERRRRAEAACLAATQA